MNSNSQRDPISKYGGKPLSAFTDPKQLKQKRVKGIANMRLDQELGLTKDVIPENLYVVLPQCRKEFAYTLNRLKVTVKKADKKSISTFEGSLVVQQKVEKMSKQLKLWTAYFEEYFKEADRRAIQQGIRDWQQRIIAKLKKGFGGSGPQKMTKTMLDNPEVDEYLNDGNMFSKQVSFFCPDYKNNDPKKPENSFLKINYRFQFNEYFYYVISSMVHIGTSMEKLKKHYMAEKYFNYAAQVSDRLIKDNQSPEICRVIVRAYVINARIYMHQYPRRALKLLDKAMKENQKLYSFLENETTGVFYHHNQEWKSYDAIVMFIMILNIYIEVYRRMDKIGEMLESLSQAKVLTESFFDSESRFFKQSQEYHIRLFWLYSKQYHERALLLNIMEIVTKQKNEIVIKPDNEENIKNNIYDVNVFNMHINEFFKNYYSQQYNITINSDTKRMKFIEDDSVRNFAKNKIKNEEDKAFMMSNITISDINKNKDTYKDELANQEQYQDIMSDALMGQSNISIVDNTTLSQGAIPNLQTDEKTVNLVYEPLYEKSSDVHSLHQTHSLLTDIHKQSKGIDMKHSMSTKDHTHANSITMLSGKQDSKLSLKPKNFYKSIERPRSNDKSFDNKFDNLLSDVENDYHKSNGRIKEISVSNSLAQKRQTFRKTIEMCNSNRAKDPYNQSNLDIYRNTTSNSFIKKGYGGKGRGYRVKSAKKYGPFTDIFEDKFTYDKRQKQSFQGDLDSSTQQIAPTNDNTIDTIKDEGTNKNLKKVKKERFDPFKIDSVHLSLFANMDKFLLHNVNYKKSNMKDLKKIQEFQTYNDHAHGMKGFLDSQIKKNFADEPKTIRDDPQNFQEDKETLYNESLIKRSTSYLDEHGKQNQVKSTINIKNPKHAHSFSVKNLFFRKNEGIDNIRSSSYIDNNPVYDSMIGYNVEGPDKVENLQDTKKPMSQSNIRIKSNQNKHHLGEWMSHGDLQHMQRSDNRVVSIRKNIFDARQKKSEILKYYPLAHFESQEKLIKFTEAKFESQKRVEDMQKLSPEMENKDIQYQTVRAQLGMKEHVSNDKPSLRDIILKHDDIFHLRKWASSLRKNQQEIDHLKHKEEEERKEMEALEAHIAKEKAELEKQDQPKKDQIKKTESSVRPLGSKQNDKKSPTPKRVDSPRLKKFKTKNRVTTSFITGKTKRDLKSKFSKLSQPKQNTFDKEIEQLDCCVLDKKKIVLTPYQLSTQLIKNDMERIQKSLHTKEKVTLLMKDEYEQKRKELYAIMNPKYQPMISTNYDMCKSLRGFKNTANAKKQDMGDIVLQQRKLENENIRKTLMKKSLTALVSSPIKSGPFSKKEKFKAKDPMDCFRHQFVKNEKPISEVNSELSNSLGEE